MIVFLLIDDSQDILKIYRSNIERKFDADIDCACTGLEALKKLDLFQYDVILSDIEMPEMNGVELYKELKEKRPEMARRMIFISGNLDGPDGLYLKKEGLPLLAKPFKMQDLLKLIDSTLKLQGKEPSDAKKRKYPRNTVMKNCFIEPVAKTITSEQIGAMAVNYSDGGMCISYNGEAIRKEKSVFVSAETLGIKRKEAKVMWSSIKSDLIQVGLKWVSPTYSTSTYH